MINNYWVVVIMVASIGCDRTDKLTHDHYQGMIEIERTDLGFELPGRVVELLVRPGAEVKVGQVIARLDDVLDRGERAIRGREVELAKAELAVVRAGSRIEDIRAARAQLVAAKATEDTLAKQVARETRLVAQGAVPASRLDDLVAQLAQARGQRTSLEQHARLLERGARTEEVTRAEARVAAADEALALSDQRLAKRTLTSPVAGTVLETYIELGEIAGAGTPIATVIDRHRPYADVFVPVADIARVTVGTPVVVTVEGGGDTPGVIERVYPHAEFTPRFVYSPRERPNLMMRARVRLDDRDGKLPAGLPAYARIASAGKP